MTLFGTAGVRGPVRDEVTPELALAVGRAAGRDGAEFAVGRDGRTTGRGLADAVAAGLQSAGADVRRVGRVPTPALAYAARGRRGVMVTASHNPPTDNGLKLFVDGVEYDADAETRVADRVADPAAPVPWDEWGDTERVDVLPAYRRAVVDHVLSVGGGGITSRHERGGVTVDDPRATLDAEPLAGLRAAVDCGNGTGSVTTPAVLRALGADVVAVSANVDGAFPARDSKPTPESLVEFAAVLDAADGEGDDEPFDLGLAHDGDADRTVVLTGDGEVVHEDTVLAVLAEHHVRRSEAADPVVVTTPNASARVDERVEAAGGRVERVRLGGLHEGVAAAREASGADTAIVFAGEPWKHVHPGLGGWIDGVATAALVATLVAGTGARLDGDGREGLAALREPVTERPYRKESVDCHGERKRAAMALVGERLPGAVEGTVDTSYGVRVDRGDGAWVLVRPSGTEPYLRVYAESDEVDALVARAVDVVEGAVADASEAEH
ncbi:phosphomannomutase [Halobacteriales archaeon SW_5_70_135]|nr:MAG: phosphomannomutase [Halobacteriales archaeon SW_5_70_135]